MQPGISSCSTFIVSFLVDDSNINCYHYYDYFVLCSHSYRAASDGLLSLSGLKDKPHHIMANNLIFIAFVWIWEQLGKLKSFKWDACSLQLTLLLSCRMWQLFPFTAIISSVFAGDKLQVMLCACRDGVCWMSPVMLHRENVKEHI